MARMVEKSSYNFPTLKLICVDLVGEFFAFSNIETEFTDNEVPAAS